MSSNRCDGMFLFTELSGECGRIPFFYAHIEKTARLATSSNQKEKQNTFNVLLKLCYKLFNFKSMQIPHTIKCTSTTTQNRLQSPATYFYLSFVLSFYFSHFVFIQICSEIKTKFWGLFYEIPLNSFSPSHLLNITSSFTLSLSTTSSTFLTCLLPTHFYQPFLRTHFSSPRLPYFPCLTTNYEINKTSLLSNMPLPFVIPRFFSI